MIKVPSATNTTNIVSSDIYGLSEFYENVRAATIPEIDESSAMVGIFGYMNEAFKETLQAAIITSSETVNETIPTKAKFSKNVMAHALNLGISNIYAVPASITIMIYLPIPYIEKNFAEYNPTTGRGKFILDCKCPFYIGDYEFHLDYDVIINRIKNANNQYVYTAMYDLFDNNTTKIKQKNPISNISNPYINNIIIAKISNVLHVGFAVRCHQVIYKSYTKNVVTNNVIENKTFTFEFDNQLAAFDIDVLENGQVTHLIPIYNGLLDYTVEDGSWCYYDFVSENMIRILFSRDSFVPGLNAQITINLYMSNGASGNFVYNNTSDFIRQSLRSSKYNNYGGMYAFIQTLENGVSGGGSDKKSIAELKKIIPREASSRGAIINTADLQNFFNSINDTNCKLYIKKKRDNPFERLYYMYMLMRRNNVIYPTNTINLRLTEGDFKGTSESNNMSITPGTKLYYYDHGNKGKSSQYASITCPTLYEADDDNITYPVTMNDDGRLVRVFEYISPFLISIDDDFIASYLLTIMDEERSFEFDSINTASELQFIVSSMTWKRQYYNTTDGSTYDNKYVMTVDITQNNLEDYGLITTSTDDEDNIVFDDVRVKMFIVLYADDTGTAPFKYLEGEISNYDQSSFLMQFKFTFTTDDLLDLKNRINVTGIYNAKPEPFQLVNELESSGGYMNKNTYAKLFILADFGTKPGDIVTGSDGVERVVTAATQETIVYGTDGIGNRSELESIIPTKNDIIDLFLRNEIYINKNNTEISVVTIIRDNELYIKQVMDYNGDESQTPASILRYLRNNRDSDFVQNVLLNDEDALSIINSYNYEDLSRYTVCNVMTVTDGINFYHDYSNIMRSTINVAPIPVTDSSGNLLYREVVRYDTHGNKYTELAPIYKTSSADSSKYAYQYTLSRLPVIKAGFLSSEAIIQDFIDVLEERRHYLEEALYILEDTFDIDFKFMNTFGPSHTFYYNIPTETSYDVEVTVKNTNVYSVLSSNMDDYIVGQLNIQQVVTINKINGQWGYITSPFTGWIKLSDTKKIETYVDNVAISMKFAVQPQTATDKTIIPSIISDIRTYIEDINNINEIHIPNIITLITNMYREQIVYFEFQGINNYGVQCQHLYIDDSESDSVDVVPEFINIALSDDISYTPQITVSVV